MSESVYYHTMLRDSVAFFLQHGETALHLAAKYNHSTVISMFASFKINMDVKGKVLLYCNGSFVNVLDPQMMNI